MDWLDVEVTTDALGALGEREQELIESRIDDDASYDEIATRFSFPHRGGSTDGGHAGLESWRS